MCVLFCRLQQCFGQFIQQSGFARARLPQDQQRLPMLPEQLQDRGVTEHWLRRGGGSLQP